MKHHQLRCLLALWLLAAIHAPAAVRFVNVNSTSPAPPHTTWATAATNIQDAIDAANAGDEIMVTNGFLPVAATVPGQSGTTTVIDTNSTTLGPAIYRVRVEE